MEINYGEEFIKLYNKEFSSFKKIIVKRIIEDYGSPVLNDILYNNYKRFINELIKVTEKTISDNGVYYIVLEQSYDLMDNDFKFERTKNIINIDFKNYFESYKENFGNTEFIYFLKQFTKYYVFKQYLKFLRDNKKAFFEHIDNKSINEFFITNYVKNDLNQLKDYPSEIEKNPEFKEEKQIEINKKEQISLIILNDDEKLLLLHLLYVCSRNANYKLNPVEFLSAIKLTNDVHNGKNLQDFYGTDYKKIKDGLKYYQGNNSKIKMMLDQINKICTDYQLSVIKDFIRTIYPK
jgi:hypothetical protein